MSGGRDIRTVDVKLQVSQAVFLNCLLIVFEQILEFSKQGESSSVSFSSFSFLIHHSHNVWADLANAAAMLKIPPSVLLGLAWGQTWACAYKCPLCSTVEMSNK